ncbi:MAG: HAMP domain-containing sensor histidine kinase [Reinekea sp.]
MRINPYSLRRLILISFFISLIPLAVLLWQSTKVLRQVSRASISYSQQSIDLVRHAEEMDNLLTDIERSVKQYSVVKTEALEDVAQKRLQNYQVHLNQLCQQPDIDIPESCDQLQEKISFIRAQFPVTTLQALDSVFTEAHQQQSSLLKAVWSYLDTRVVEQREYVERQQRHINILLVSLVMATFILIVFISDRLAAPVRLLEEKIKRIGSGSDTPQRQKKEAFVGPEEFHRINEHLDWLAARLIQLESLRQAFLRHSAHELKTPLSSIKEGCSILSEQLAGPLTMQQVEVIKLLDDGVERLQKLTEQLLDYNYLLQQSPPDLVKQKAPELINQCLSIYDLAFRQRQQSVTIDCELQEFWSDNKLFTRIVDNLLSNAQAYGEQGGKVLVRLTCQQDNAVLVVANTGPEVHAEQKSLLFKPFHRGGAVRQDSIKGSGLGLSIVRDCAQLLGGTAELLESNQYQFGIVVTLPQPAVARTQNLKQTEI